VITIDPEFAGLIPPLSKEERAGLEASIKREGCHTALVAWGDILLDGHNRYEICTRLHKPFEVLTKRFSGRREARIWILKNQLSRRNLTETVRMDLALLLKSETQMLAQERKVAGNSAGGKSSRNSDATSEYQNLKEAEPVRTDTTLAEIAGVGKDKLREYEHIKETATPELVAAVQDGKVSVHAGANVAKFCSHSGDVSVCVA